MGPTQVHLKNPSRGGSARLRIKLSAVPCGRPGAPADIGTTEGPTPGHTPRWLGKPLGLGTTSSLSVQGKQASICGLMQAPAITHSSCPPCPLCCLQRAGDDVSSAFIPEAACGWGRAWNLAACEGTAEDNMRKATSDNSKPIRCKQQGSSVSYSRTALSLPMQPEIGGRRGRQALTQPHTHTQPLLYTTHSTASLSGTQGGGTESG